MISETSSVYNIFRAIFQCMYHMYATLQGLAAEACAGSVGRADGNSFT